MRILTLPLYLCLMAVQLPLSAGAACREPVAMTIRVYDWVGVDTRQLRQAREELVWIFRRANVSVSWVQCELKMKALPPGSACRDSPHSFAVGILSRAPGCVSQGALGFALISPGGLRHAGIVYPRVADLARSAGLETYRILGQVIAHEVAHLVLGSTAHRLSGIMRSEYGPAELQAMSQSDLSFCSREAAEIRRRLE